MRTLIVVVGIISGALVSCLGGCSVNGGVDVFYPAEKEPRKTMPWYNSHGKDVHSTNDGFKGMGN